MSPDGYDLLLADPPWPYDTWSSAAHTRTAAHNYPVMTYKQIAAYGTALLADEAPEAALFMWAPPTHLPWVPRVMASWGFTYRAIGATWIKLGKKPLDAQALSEAVRAQRTIISYRGKPYRPHYGLGHYVRGLTEFLVLGTRGRRRPDNTNLGQDLYAPIREHSRKPDEQYERINTMYPNAQRRLELFARESREGWETRGDERSKFDDQETDSAQPK